MPSPLTRFLPVLGICFALHVAAQEHYGEVWQFGLDVGLDFSRCAPMVVTGANAGFEGCASVCDGNGQLLFYTNTETVWNRMHAPMPHGLLYPGANTLSQVIIAHSPATDPLYYLVTTTIQAQGPGHLRYQVIDMSQNGGLGDVVSMDHVLYADTSTEQVAATRHANGSDTWVVAHAYPGNSFLAYLLTGSGLSTTPVVSSVGPPFVRCNSNVNARGEIKFSVDGTRLAICGNGVGNDTTSDVLALFHFDATTGVVSDPLELPPGRGDYGLSFSPDGSKLYGATWKALNFGQQDMNELYQFDLSSGDPATIITSRQVLHTSSTAEPFGDLKLGPDGHIYVASSNSAYLGVVQSPNEAGTACDYVHDGLYLEGATSGFGLNNYIEYVDCDVSTLAPAVRATSADLSFFPNPTEGSITVRGVLSNNVRSIRISDAAGRYVLTLDASAGPTFDLSRLLPGNYLASFQDADGRVRSYRSLVLLP